MNSIRTVVGVLLLAAGVFPLPQLPCAAAAADSPSSNDDPADAYTRTIEKRADDVIAALDLTDSKKSAGVRDVLLAHYRALKSWHDDHDAKLKELSKRSKDDPSAKAEVGRAKLSLKTEHEQFVTKLSTHLTAEQVEKVKDKMTYNVVQVTVRAYDDMLPALTAEQKTFILATLKEAREEAMDGGSSEEKHAVFGRYKGRINNYLSKQGYDLKQASREWADRQNAKKAAKK